MAGPTTWSSERVIDAPMARALIAEQFPALAPTVVEPLGHGFDNTAYLVDDTWVFRFPRRAVAAPLILREAAVLPTIAQRVPLPIPVPEHIGRPSARFPWPFAGYRALAGTTACAAVLSEDQRAAAAVPLGRFLAALHAFPAARARALGVIGDELGRVDVLARTVKAKATLAGLQRVGLVDAALVERCEAVLQATPTNAQRPLLRLVHGDLYARHVLVGPEGEPAGVIDWGDLHLGDPAVDLALGYGFFPPGPRDMFFQAYGTIDAATRELARFRALYHGAAALQFATDIGDTTLVGEGKRALAWATEG